MEILNLYNNPNKKYTKWAQKQIWDERRKNEWTRNKSTELYDLKKKN